MSTPKPLTLVVPDPGGGDYRLQEQVGFALRKANQRHLAIFAAQIGEMTPPRFENRFRRRGLR